MVLTQEEIISQAMREVYQKWKIQAKELEKKKFEEEIRNILKGG